MNRVKGLSNTNWELRYSCRDVACSVGKVVDNAVMITTYEASCVLGEAGGTTLGSMFFWLLSCASETDIE